MNTSELLCFIDSEITTLQQVRDLLAGVSRPVAGKPGQVRTKRAMSIAGRDRIAAAQRKRWAAWKKGKKAA